MTTNELQSKVFDFLRFPLIVGVVFIHNYSSTITVQGIELGSEGDMPLYYVCSELFSQVIARIAVPLFFFMSGYLFFFNTEFNKEVYIRKIKSRSRTLLVPYLFWNAAFLVVYYVASHLPGISSFFKGADYTWEFIWCSFLGRMDNTGTMTYPLAYQFWFIRDLMVIVLLTPLVYRFLKCTNYYGLVVVGLLCFFGFSIPYLGIRGFSTTAWFFFMAGAWFSIYKKNVIEEVGRVGNWIYLLYIAIVIADLCTKKEVSFNSYIHQLGILAGLICCFKLSAYLIGKREVKPTVFLSSASFFVFAIHDPWLLSQFKKILFKVFQPESDITLTALYFIVVILVVVVSLLLYYLLKRFLPRFTAVITGGR